MLWLRDTPGSDLWRTRRQLYNRHFPAVFWWLLLLMIAYLGITMVAQYHAVHLIAHPLASGDFVSSVLTAGLMEEFLMRGFFMNALLAHYGWVKANVIQAVLFQMTHFPLYFLEGLSVMGWVANITSVLPLGFLFGWLFYHSKNLWPGTILHCVWDTGVTLFL